MIPDVLFRAALLIETYEDLFPELCGHPTLVPAPALRESRESDEHAPGIRAKVCVTDWNGDGRLDLLMGDFSYQQVTRGELTEEELEKKNEIEKLWTDAIASYRKGWEKYGNRRQGSEADAKQRQERFQEEQKDLISELELIGAVKEKYQTSRHETHGFVSLLSG